MGRWIELLKYFRRDDRSNFETVRFNRTMATITTIIRSRTSIAAIMTSGLLRYRTCLPNKAQVVAIPTCLRSDGTRSLPLPIVNIRTGTGRSYTMVTRFLFHGAPIIERRKTRSNIVSPLLFSLHFEDDINSKFGRAIRYDKI